MKTLEQQRIEIRALLSELIDFAQSADLARKQTNPLLRGDDFLTFHLKLLKEEFEVFSAEATAERQGRCPLQLAGYKVGVIPLFHLLNRPNPSRLRHAIAASYDLAA